MVLKNFSSLCVKTIPTMLVVGLIAGQAVAQVDYSTSLAANFEADYMDTGSGPQPQNNPFGDWRFLGVNGTTADLISKPGGLTASGQAGWENEPAQGGPWTYFRGPWQPGVTIIPSLAGHAPQEVVWTAPASVNAGGISISGAIEQMFEQSRVQRLAVFKNNDANASFFVDTLPPIVNGVILQKVDFGPWNIPVSPGDTLKFRVDGSGAGGSGVPTFVAWDVALTEIVPEPATAGMLLACGLGMIGLRRRRAG